MSGIASYSNIVSFYEKYETVIEMKCQLKKTIKIKLMIQQRINAIFTK